MSKRLYPTKDDKIDAEELDNCRRSPLYLYNKYIRKEGDPQLTQEQWDERIRNEMNKRGRKPTPVDMNNILIVDDTE